MTTASAPPSPSLLARVAAALAAWLPARRARLARPGAAAGASAQWTQLAQLATRFFDVRGLAPEDPAQPWAEAGNRLLRKGPRRYLVHAAHWQAARVDAATVQAVLRAVAQQRATAGIVLCARDVFTPAARALARENAILLLEPGQLRQLVDGQALYMVAGDQPQHGHQTGRTLRSGKPRVHIVNILPIQLCHPSPPRPIVRPSARFHRNMR